MIVIYTSLIPKFYKIKSMKNLNILFILILAVTFHSSISSADTVALRIVDKFIVAVQSKDKIKINQAIEELKSNLEAQHILRNNWPDHFVLFNLSQLSNRIKNLKRNFGFSSTSVTPGAIPSSSSKGLSSNKDLVHILETSNRILARRDTFISNDKIVRQFPNQKEESNQDRIRRRR